MECPINVAQVFVIPGLITLFKLNALQETVRLVHLRVFDCCIMSYLLNLLLVSQQVPWELSPQRSATLDDTTNDDTMIQSRVAPT